MVVKPTGELSPFKKEKQNGRHSKRNTRFNSKAWNPDY